MANTKNFILAALFAAILALCAWLCIPVSGIGVTMQTFGVFLTLGLLGGKWGSVAIGCYLLLGAVGVPVFSGFRGGPGMLLGVTGGYLWGFALSGLVYWMLERWSIPMAMAGAMVACYLCGSVWFSLYAGGGLGYILLQCVIPYLIPDAVKIYLAYKLTLRLRPHLRRMNGSGGA